MTRAPTVPTDPPPSHLVAARVRAEHAAGLTDPTIWQRDVFGTLRRGRGNAYTNLRRDVYVHMRKAGLSYPEIAWACGQSNHSTVWTSVQRAVIADLVAVGAES